MGFFAPEDEGGRESEEEGTVGGGLGDVGVDLVVPRVPAGVVGVPAGEDDLAFGQGAHVVQDVLGGAGPVGRVEEVGVLRPVDDVERDARIEEAEGGGKQRARS